MPKIKLSFFCLLLAAYCILSLKPAQASTLWYAETKAVKQIDTATNQIIQTIPLSKEAQEPKAVAIDQNDNTLSILSKKQLFKLDSSGNLLLQANLKDIAKDIEEPDFLILNPYDGSLWLGAKKTILHLDKNGNSLSQTKLDNNTVKDMTISLDETLWLIAEKELIHISKDNQIILTQSLEGIIAASETPKHIAVDSINSLIYIATEDEIIQLDINNLASSAKGVLPSATATELKAIAINRQTGDLWFITQDTLYRYQHTTGVLDSISISQYGWSGIKAISIEPATQSLWLATEKAVIRLSGAGIPVNTFAADKQIRAIAAAPFQVMPVISLKEPPKDGLTNNPMPDIKFTLGSSCNTTSCTLQNIYAGKFNLNITLNAAPIGNLFTIQDNEAFYTPTVRLPEGANTITAKATDQFSHTTDTITSSFTIDTIPPHFVSITPADGTVLTQSQAQTTISGSVDDPEAIVSLVNMASLGAAVISSGQSFSYKVPLKEGTNSFTFTAYDKAGNSSRTTITITYRIPLTLTVISPASGTTVNTGAITVTGSATGPSGISVTVNGIPAAKDTSGNYSAAVSISEGANTIIATAKSADGQSAIQTVSITYRIPLVLALTSPASGATVTTGSIAITGMATGPSGISVTVNGVIATKDTSGNFSAATSLSVGSNTITVTATSADGQSASQTIQITYEEPNPLPPDPALVATEIDPTVATTAYSATAFLYTGDNPIQTGVAAGTIEPKRIAVLRGKVSDDAGSPLSGVTITILNHTEFGSTLTRADGMFDMAVNGGGYLTVYYQKDGYLPVQRQVDAPWQDYAWLPDVIMLSYDTKVTTIDLNSTTAIQTARGNPVTDADGTRTATLLFPQGASATMMLADGTTQPITTLNVRATEYTVGANGPNKMPAPLPPTSGYTYAVEFSADEAVQAGAKYVTFTKTVISYTENFLNFPVGTPVPVGYYDKDKGQWVPSDNGIIIKILSITNGMADIDINGTNTAATTAQLSSLGITDAERQQLASLYQAGQSLWRVQLYKLMDPDYNWSVGVAIAQDAKNPNQPIAKTYTPQDDPTPQCGSIIGCETQTLGESVNITGTLFTLHYQSDRVTGRKASRTLEIPLSGSSVPSSLLRIELEIYVAGRKFIKSFGAATNQSYTFIWDGKDAYGRTVQGQQEVNIRIGYVYKAVYFAPDLDCPKSFACYLLGTRMSNAGNSFSAARGEYVLWQEQKTSISTFDASALGFGAWMLTIQRAYDPTGQTLYLGSGEKRSAKDINNIITTVAGNGAASYSGDGGTATNAQLFYPSGAAVDGKGNLFIADFYNHRIRKVDSHGIITTVAGNGTGGYSGDNGPATSAKLSIPWGVAVDGQGNLFIADSSNNRIRKVSPDGIITTVAGNGITGYSGDNGPAINAKLYYPTAIAVDGQGSLFIADSSNNRIRRISPDGIITTVAGNGTGGYSGDNGPAIGAKLYNPYSVAVDGQGNIFIADQYNNRIRKVSPDGIITTVAGNGNYDYSGDGGAATNAMLMNPQGVAVDEQGNLFIADFYNSRIRKVVSDGIITTVAGNGVVGYSGNGGPATAAKLYYPTGVSVDRQGYLFIADFYNHRIRKVAPPLPGFSGQDIAIPSEDGKELYGFDQYGKHLKTVDAITAVTKYTFTYNTAGYLTSITDRDGNITTIERYGSNNATAIIASGGQRTILTMDANGYLASITNPNNEAHQMAYTADGLLTSFTNPKGSTSTFDYDTLGRLIKDTNAIGGSKALTRTDNSSSKYTVAVSTALGRTDTYTVETLSTGDTKRTSTNPNNLTATTNIGINGTTTTTSPDGTVITKTEGADPRWGMQSPVVTSMSIKTPSGLTYSLTGSRTATLSDSTNLLSLTNATDTVTVNSKSYTSAYTASTKTITSTSPVGRKSYTTLDSLGRISSEQFDSLNAVNYSYDAKGRLTTITQGTGADVRNYSIAYDPVGWALPTSITDPLGRSINFVYDNAGRVTQKTLPDGRAIMFSYDANGNITSITPPSRPSHTFTYTGVDLEESYTPPVAAPFTGANTSTTYTYNLDKQITLITRPDRQTISLNYDSGGRLSGITSPAVIPVQTGIQLSYAYSSTTGNLSSITAPSETLSFTYDGSLLKGTAWSGSIAGSVGFTYNSDFRVSSESVNGANSVNFTYDNDGLLTGAGSLTLSRNTSNGLISGTTLGSITTSQSYNGFGEMSQLTTSYGSSSTFNVQYTRDALGRITQKVETAHGVANTYAYSYDTAGRLTEVKLNGAIKSQYSYDSNSNRISYTDSNGTVAGSYDNQDRLLSYGNNSYTYSANGELQSKTSASGTTNYSYDVLGNLTAATLFDGTAIEYIVDGQNRRIGKKTNGTLSQGFLYENQLRPVAELDGTGNIVSRFVYGTKINVPDYMMRSGATYRIITDHLGSPRFVINTSTGTVAQELDYDEFGNIIFDTNPGFQPFGFAGGLYDQHTKLTRFGARDYDAETGRWTAKDPTLFNGGDVNLYSMTENDTVNWIDSEGYFKLPADPSGLPPGWKQDPSDPRGRTYINPDEPGRKLRFDPAQPDSTNPNKQKNHWHDDIPGQKTKEGRKHRLPGEEVPDPPLPPYSAPFLKPPVPIFLIPVYCASPGASEEICGRCPGSI